MTGAPLSVFVLISLTTMDFALESTCKSGCTATVSGEMYVTRALVQVKNYNLSAVFSRVPAGD